MSSAWHAGPVIDWLLVEGRFRPDLEGLAQGLAERLIAAGVPLSRLRLSMRTLHPLLTGYTALWDRHTRGTRELVTPHGLERRSTYIGSPLAAVARTGKPYRRRLSEPLTENDHAILYELKAQGATDYFALPLRLTGSHTASAAFTTDRTGGFTDHDLQELERMATALAPVVEVFGLRLTAAAVARAYLGPRTGERVMAGEITRGHVDTIEAAILVSDIRGWTELNNRLPLTDLVGMANRYFEIIDEAVSAHQGEILKLIGDGVLAVFPTDGKTDAATACLHAWRAATISLAAAHDGDFAFGIGMHFGQVLYGNIGSEARLDFTVLGPAVNIAARIESLCRKLEQPVLFSRDFADHLPIDTHHLSTEHLKGIAEPFAILTAPIATAEG